MISGHSFRISRIDDSLNKYQLRIDNRTFDEVRLGKGMSIKSSAVLNFEKKSNDPFAEFQSFASSSKQSNTYQTSKTNAFGDFDFQSFTKKPSTTIKSTTTVPTMKIEQKSSPSSSNLLDFPFTDTSKTQQTVPVNDFQTNSFKTNSGNNGFDDFLSSFKQNEANLLDNEDQFATNAYINRNYYLDLQANKQEQSDKFFGDGFTFTPTEQPSNKTIKQNLMEYNKMAGLAAKKAANTMAMKFNEIKKTFNESLI